MTKIRVFLLSLLVVLIGVALWQRSRIGELREESERNRQNSEALFANMKRWRIDSTRMAVDSERLCLTISQLEKYRAQDAETIKALGVRIDDLKSVSEQRLDVEVPFEMPLANSRVAKVENPFLQLDASVEDDVLLGNLQLSVTLRQAVWVEYRRRWLFWRRAVGVHQSVVCDNPYIDIAYSEYIELAH